MAKLKGDFTAAGYAVKRANCEALKNSELKDVYKKYCTNEPPKTKIYFLFIVLFKLSENSASKDNIRVNGNSATDGLGTAAQGTIISPVTKATQKIPITPVAQGTLLGPTTQGTVAPTTQGPTATQVNDVQDTPVTPGIRGYQTTPVAPTTPGIQATSTTPDIQSTQGYPVRPATSVSPSIQVSPVAPGTAITQVTQKRQDPDLSKKISRAKGGMTDFPQISKAPTVPLSGGSLPVSTSSLSPTIPSSIPMNAKVTSISGSKLDESNFPIVIHHGVPCAKLVTAPTFSDIEMLIKQECERIVPSIKLRQNCLVNNVTGALISKNYKGKTGKKHPFGSSGPRSTIAGTNVAKTSSFGINLADITKDATNLASNFANSIASFMTTSAISDIHKVAKIPEVVGTSQSDSKLLHNNCNTFSASTGGDPLHDLKCTSLKPKQVGTSASVEQVGHSRRLETPVQQKAVKQGANAAQSNIPVGSIVTFKDVSPHADFTITASKMRAPKLDLRFKVRHVELKPAAV